VVNRTLPGWALETEAGVVSRAPKPTIAKPKGLSRFYRATLSNMPLPPLTFASPLSAVMTISPKGSVRPA
jgi:hypothetical protein